ncbi:CHAT domain-containing protein [Oscillochloris sp. ZM17-4]|uniref:CHAT domain-containing protein n=1 Tax=Oscillochloris sp. ZM17-4 TaxID=2866714 RepID=UPI001C72EE9B|nr:CHAT domain-containing protein [Oscillochloris sp. ZM17-4]MBX0331333.1 CHAT domain-containing protein [Oscillochloris sp. ZM17-4]
MPHTTITLHIHRLPDASLVADAELTSVASAAPAQLATNAPVVLDAEALLGCSNDPVTYGTALAAQLFAAQPLREAWLKARAYAAAGDLQLRLRLDATAPDLHALRWETLRDPENGQPIALYEHVRLVRTLDTPNLTPVAIPPRPDLHALVVVSNPSNLRDYNLAEVDVDGEIGRARTALGDIPTTILGDHPDAAGRATLTNLAAQLRNAPPIMLLVAHGGQSLLWLEHDDGMANPVASADVVVTVERLVARPLLLALLSCQSAGRGYGDTLSALGPGLARIGVPAVLGFQGNVAMSTVRTFLPIMISELRRDGQIDRALAAARAALGEQNPWWQAVLWLRTDGRLWQELEEPALNRGLALLQAMPLDTIPNQAPLPPSPLMPLPRNSLFVGRKADLHALAQALKGQETIAIGHSVAVTGMGGIGKTNLASEFVHRYGQFFAGGVYWISFTDPATIPFQVAACGDTLGITSSTDLKLDELVRQVQTAWQLPIPRLLIFDNCDDITPGQSEALLQQWRPTAGGCRVLVTSQHATWSKSLNITAMPLNVLSRAESVSLLRGDRRDLAEDNSDLDAIAEELGDLPLALHLAGSFLDTYRDSPVFGDPARFLVELRNVRLLDHDALKGIDVTLSATKHEQHVARTFVLSYARLDATDPNDAQAITLLARAACFAPGKPIPRSLLLATLDLTEDDQTAQRHSERGLRRLIDLGLLEPADNGMLRLHRLLAIFVHSVAMNEQAQAATEATVLAQAKRDNDEDNPLILESLGPHLRFIAAQAFARTDMLAASLCYEADRYLVVAQFRMAARSRL